MQALLDLSWFEFIEETIQFCFGLICHQDRSILFNIAGSSLPLCPRCIGMQLGFTALIIFHALFNFKLPRMRNRTSQILISSAICLAGIHWIAGQLGLLEMESIFRLITGFITGAAVSFFLYSYRYGSHVITLRINVQKRKLLLQSLVIITVGLTTSFISNYSLLLFFLSLSVFINISTIVKTLILLLIRFQSSNFISTKKLNVIK
jgi:uncharacterized membrane protein